MVTFVSNEGVFLINKWRALSSYEYNNNLIFENYVRI